MSFSAQLLIGARLTSKSRGYTVEPASTQSGGPLSMRSIRLAVCAVTFSAIVFAQSDRGTITGTVADPAGAVIPNASVQLRNVDTGAVYDAGASATGNYTLAQVPAGQYELTVDVQGFKKYVRKNVRVEVTQT